ncbi:MAG: energy transducer TonB, partial [Pseudomonadota bacterium]
MLAHARTTLFVVLSFLTLSSSIALGDDDVAALNAAWQAYLDAKESGDNNAIVDAAEMLVGAGRNVYGEDDNELPLLLHAYGKALLDNGQNEAASVVLSESLQLSEQLHGKDAVELLPILEDLGDSVGKPRSSSRQFRYYRRGLKIIERHYGKESETYADAAVRAALQGYERSHTTDGINYLHDARKIYINLPGETSSEAGLTDYLLAKFAFSRGNNKSAVKYGLAALPNLEGDSEQLRNLQLFTRALLVKAYEERNMSDEATPHCIAIGKISKTASDQEYLPLFRMAPAYPMNELRRGNEGHVDFKFTIDEHGFVRDPQVLVSSNKAFETAGLRWSGEALLARNQS